MGRAQGKRNRAATPGAGRNRYSAPLLGTAFVHTVIDDHQQDLGNSLSAVASSPSSRGTERAVKRQVIDQKALAASAAASTKASAKLEGRVVPPSFVRSPRVEKWLAERRRSA